MLRPLTLLLALTLAPAFAACDDAAPDDGGGTGGNADCDNGSMTATVDGSSFSAECVILDLSNGLLTVTGVANVTGSSGSDQETITIGGAQAQTGAQTPTVATYAAGDDPSNIVACASSALPGLPAPSLTIDAVDDDSAAGSFSFTALCPDDGSQVTVTGDFDVSM